METFPDLFAICENPEGSIKSLEHTELEPNLQKIANGWEVERVDNLLGRIGDINGTNFEPDTLRWET